MNEIEKMYRTAKVVPSYHYCNDCQYDMSAECPIRCPDNVAVYPPFTAEKQLAIVKFLLNKSVYYDTDGDREYWFHISDEIENSKYREFDEAIAECINKMWDDLRDYEKVQIKEILE